MKRIYTLAAFLLAVLLCGCTVKVRFAGPPAAAPAPSAVSGGAVPAAAGVFGALLPAAAEGEVRGVWVSYTELNPEKLQTKTAFRRRVRRLLSPMKALSVTDVFLQVRPFADSIYPSKLFPSSSAVVRHRGDKLPLDFLAVFLSEAKAAGLRVHAWINPYRVSTSTEQVLSFAADPAVGPLLKEDGAPCVLAWNGGVYLDPASAAVQKLVVRGVRELLETYDLAGVHIDDYFYPTADAAFDAQRYEAYRSNGGTADLLSFRKAHVSRLVRMLYRTVKESGKEKVFSISPAADIEKNEQVFAADVRLWGSENGYCDWLIPQIYFGMHHETRPFAACVKEWRALCTSRNVRLLAGLAAYKIGKEDAFAGTGSEEWKRNTAILGDQVLLLRQNGLDGFALFSASFLNFDKKLCAKVLKNLKDVL